MSLFISEHICKKLSASEVFAQLVGDKIFAISTKESTTFPFVVYKRNSLTPGYTKDRHDTSDAIAVDIVVVSDNYLNSIEIAEAIRLSLECKRGKYDTFSVIDARLLSADEDFIEDSFIQRLSFSFTTETE